MDPQPEEIHISDLNDFTDVDNKSSFTPKPDLESLGFVINNGKPRFKLDEPTSTNFYPNVQLSKTDCSLDDDSDTLSFVILGKKSLDSIQESSLATYTDIQRKSMSIDYNSIISSLNSSEIQQKLTELLQENVKLKETLKQNTTAMKQQFNTLAMWQEEVMNVHKHHKQKFTETRHLINLLKQENAELKLKLYTMNTDDAMPATITETDNLIHLNQLQEKVSSLSDELNNFKSDCAHLCEGYKKCVNSSNAMDTQLKETTHTKEEGDLKMPETDVIADNIQVKEICKLSSLLEDEIKSLCTSINVNVEQMSDQMISSQSHYSVESIKQYGEMLQELTDCFIRQITRYSAIQKCIKACVNILDACESIKLPEKYDTIEESWSLQLGQLQIYKEKLSICQKMLLEEQLKLITDKQSFIKTQNQFQKIFSDYNSILYELQIMSTENSKLQIMKDTISKESSQRITELEKHKHQHEERYKEIKDILEQERQCWNEQKRSLDNQRKSLNMEYKSLLEQKEMLFSLHEEKALVSKQCELHENNEKILQVEKDTLEKNNEQLIADAHALRNEIAEKDNALRELTTKKREQDELLKQQAEEIELLKTQVLYYEEDFQSEKKAKEKILLETRQLQAELQNAYLKNFHNIDPELN